MRHLRLFFSVDLDEKVRAEVARESHEIRRHLDADLKIKGRKWAWVSDHNFHLTVKFLGPTPEERAIQAIATARDVLSTVPAFEMEVAGVGAFPRVLWMDVKDPSASLARIATQLDQALEPLGVTKESRAFVPHLTLARLKEGKPIFPERDLKGEWRARSFGKCLVREVILYRSDTRPTGAVYEPVERFALHQDLLEDSANLALAR